MMELFCKNSYRHSSFLLYSQEKFQEKLQSLKGKPETEKLLYHGNELLNGCIKHETLNRAWNVWKYLGLQMVEILITKEFVQFVNLHDFIEVSHVFFRKFI